MFSNFETVYVRRLVCASLILGASASLAFADGPMNGVELQKLAPGNYHVVAPGVSLDITLETPWVRRKLAHAKLKVGYHYINLVFSTRENLAAPHN